MGAATAVTVVQSLSSAIALVAGGGALALVGLRVAARSSSAAANLGARVVAWRGAITAVVAGCSVAGSLYFSEVAQFLPCRLCWFQRVAMYPIVVIAVVGLIRRDAAARWYALSLAVLGIGVSAYHYLIEWRPELEAGSCSAFGPPCTIVWFRSFGFVSLALMALCGFAAIIAVNTITFAQEGARHLLTHVSSEDT